MLIRQDLMTLEAYAAVRDEYRDRARQHRRARQVELGRHITLCFEDRDTVLYQIQEMLYIESTFDAQGIQDELAAYTPLIPTGTNVKATMMIEYSDTMERAQRLKELLGIESRVYIEVYNQRRVYAVADEDLPRSDSEKTSAVHFLRFEFDKDFMALLAQHSDVIVGVDHAKYNASSLLTLDTQANLFKDLANFNR